MADSDETNLKDYERWRKLNREQFSLYDYAYASVYERQLPADAMVALAALVWPPFRDVDGLVLLAEQYDATKLARLRAQGLSEGQLEYWMNLFSVDGLFQSLPGATRWHMRGFANTLHQSWRAKLRQDYPMRRFRVEVVTDDEVGDVCVVFYRADS